MDITGRTLFDRTASPGELPVTVAVSVTAVPGATGLAEEASASCTAPSFDKTNAELADILTVPATSPFTQAMTVASLAETLRVRLLSKLMADRCQLEQ